MSTFSFRALALIAARVARLIRSLREKKDSSKLTRVLTIYATRCIGLPVRCIIQLFRCRGKFADKYKKGKGSPYSITERRLPELIPVLGSQPAGDVSHKPGGKLPLLSARPAVTPATLKRAATNFAAW